MTARSTPIPVGALGVDPGGGYLRGMHIEWGVPLQVVISGIRENIQSQNKTYVTNLRK